MFPVIYVKTLQDIKVYNERQYERLTYKNSKVPFEEEEKHTKHKLCSITKRCFISGQKVSYYLSHSLFIHG